MLKTSIPFVDLRDKTPIDLLRAYPDKAHALVRASRGTFGRWSQAASALALPLADRLSHDWLKRTANPYLHEIESFADILGTRGVYTLNAAYEWGCTSGVYRHGGNVSMLRVLDWPFPELGLHVMVTLQQGKAGEYHNITWPAMSGVITGMASGRFSAAINQAPMRGHRRGFIGDWLHNRILTNRADGLPPAHLLRQVFEQAMDYDQARTMLATTRVALPVIYILAGTRPGQGCIIERLENSAEITELGAGQGLTAANHFTSRLAAEGKGWRPRAIDSHGRWRQSCSIHGHDLEAGNFEWLKGPIVNQYTRLCVIADAGTGRLSVQGFEGMTQVTDIFHLPGSSNTEEGIYEAGEVY